jgi:hypothetical protein
MDRMRAAAFLLFAACRTAAADPPPTCFEKDLDCYGMKVAQRGDNVVACCGEQCLVVEPESGKVVGTQSTPVSGVDPHFFDDEPDLLDSSAFKRCGAKCTTLKKRLAARAVPVAAIDPTGHWLFEIEPGGSPTLGNTWNLTTGKRIAKFAMDEFGGPPPPTDFDAVEIAGRHAIVGTPGNDYRIVYDLFTGAMDISFETTNVGRGLVVQNDGLGRVDLRDYNQAGHPIVAWHRVKKAEPDHGAMSTHTVPLGDKALVVVEEPQATVLVDVAKRRVGKPRSLVCH